MNFIISTHHYILPVSLLQKVDRKLSKFDRLLPNMNRELCKGTLDIKKHSKIFEASVNIQLPRKTVSAKAQNDLLWLAIRNSIDESLVGLNKYKQLHFSSHSKYPNHSTLRSTS